MFRPETPQGQPEIDSDNHASPATTNGSSSIATPSLPWSDASLHSFLDNDTSIRDVLVLIHEGGRLKKGSSVGSINPQIADLYSACAIHIEEMSSVRVFLYLRTLADVMSLAFGRCFDVLFV
jgi:hypothetical protein